MANEAVQIEGPYEVHDFTVLASDAVIEKGALCKLSGDRIAFTSAAADIFAGVAMTEKSITNDTSTNLGLATTGIFDMTVGESAITAGATVSLSGINKIKTAVAAELLTGAGFGKALETGAAADVIEVRLGVGA